MERMGGDMLDTIADAIENSAVVLICYSKKYKESKFCKYDIRNSIYNS